jgi:hypothetical protein
VKDAYKALKDKLAIWAVGDVAELEKTQHSDLRKAVIAEVVNNHPAEDQAKATWLRRSQKGAWRN